MQNNTFSPYSTQQGILVVDKTDSTNTYLKNLCSNFKPLDEFSAIMTLDQTAGRGLRGNTWESQAGKNLTFSLILYPDFLSVDKQFLISACISVSVFELLNELMPNVKIKWPNDLYVNNKKICGILIENLISHNHIKQSIVGIGLNVNQIHFNENLIQKATSISLETNLNDLILLNICKKLLELIKKNYEKLKSDNGCSIMNQYNFNLFQKNSINKYTINNQLVKGEIVDVEIDGLLKIKVNGTLKKYDLKDIIYHI